MTDREKKKGCVYLREVAGLRVLHIGNHASVAVARFIGDFERIMDGRSDDAGSVEPG